MAAENISFNVLKHDLVPEHHLLTEDEAVAMLNRKGMTRDQLPTTVVAWVAKLN